MTTGSQTLGGKRYFVFFWGKMFLYVPERLTQARFKCLCLTVRWRAAQTRPLCSSSPDEEQPRPSMLRHLTSKIKATGPISVAEYMREVLTNPVTVGHDL